MKNRTKASREKYVKQRNLVNSTRRTVKQNCRKKLGRELEEDLQGNKKLLYNLAKSYRQGDKESVAAVKDQEGNLLVHGSRRYRTAVDTVFQYTFKCARKHTEADGTEEEVTTGEEEDTISLEEVKKAVEYEEQVSGPRWAACRSLQKVEM